MPAASASGGPSWALTSRAVWLSPPTPGPASSTRSGEQSRPTLVSTPRLPTVLHFLYPKHPTQRWCGKRQPCTRNCTGWCGVCPDDCSTSLPPAMAWTATAPPAIARSDPLWGSAASEHASCTPRRWSGCLSATGRRHPGHSYTLRSLLGRHSPTDYQAAATLAHRWLRRRGGRYGR